MGRVFRLQNVEGFQPLNTFQTFRIHAKNISVLLPKSLVQIQNYNKTMSRSMPLFQIIPVHYTIISLHSIPVRTNRRHLLYFFFLLHLWGHHFVFFYFSSVWPPVHNLVVTKRVCYGNNEFLDPWTRVDQPKSAHAPYRHSSTQCRRELICSESQHWRARAPFCKFHILLFLVLI